MRRIVALAGSAGGAVCKSVGTRGNTNPRPGSGPLCYWKPRKRMYNCTVHQIVMYSKLNKIYTVYYISYAQ